MNRRDFLNYSLPATGAILLSPTFFSYEAFGEINRQFIGNSSFNEYDLVINGAGLAGYFMALEGAKKGLKVLIVDKRSSPGFEITAKRRLWIGNDGFDEWDDELKNLFSPETELIEVSNRKGIGHNGSLFGNELLLLCGTVKKSILRNLLVNNIHVMLMTDVCGILSDMKSVKGVLLATKQGLYSVNCKNFVDASDNLLFSRDLLNQPYNYQYGGFVLELLKVQNPGNSTIEVPEEYGIYRNSIRLHEGKNADHQAFMEFRFPVNGKQPEDVEIQARLIAARIGKNLGRLDDRLKEAQVHYYSLESSVFLEAENPPKPTLNGHYLFPTIQDELTCNKISGLKQTAGKLLKYLRTGRTKGQAITLLTCGSKIPINAVNFEDPEEPGFAIPLKKCSFNTTEYIKNELRTDVLVAGGGTAGAVAATGALEKGADTMVVDYFNDLGGTKTMGGVMGYYLGITDNSFIKFLEEEANRHSAEINFTAKTGRKSYFLKQLLDLDGMFISGAIICEAISTENAVEGIIVCRNGKLTRIQAAVTIDSTGDGDVAHFAGIPTAVGNTRTGITQNYSQWNLTGGGKVPSYPNSDYDILDITKVSELQRGLFLSHYEAHFYDFHPYLTVREARRAEGLYELTVIDAVEETHFEDMIGLANSDYDPHYIGSSELIRCGFLLPHSNHVTVEIPYRAIVPRRKNGLLISGRAISQTHNALQFTRMSADVTLLGYVTGQIAAHLAIENTDSKDFDVSTLQKEWFARGFFPENYQTKVAINKTKDPKEIANRIEKLAEGKKEFLYECCKLGKEDALPGLEDKFANTTSAEGKLLSAKALAWFGNPKGNDLIEQELKELYTAEMQNGYPGGYMENYDFIRGREKNVLEGLFWRINQNIGLLAMSGSDSAEKSIKYIIENTTSGGERISWSGDRGDYFDTRIDLRIIPNYNRIYNLCFYAERNPNPKYISGLEKILDDERIKGFITEDYQSTRWRVYGGNLELYIGAALARCGSLTGYKTLIAYLDDIHYNFKNFAAKELTSITGVDYGFSKKLWSDHLTTLKFPQPCYRYFQEIEL